MDDTTSLWHYDVEGEEAMADDYAPHHALLLQFLGALLQRTVDCPTVTAHQQALQGFLDDLTPWVSPVEILTLLEQPFTLFDHLAFQGHSVFGKRLQIKPKTS
jgi:hypothetical protein